MIDWPAHACPNAIKVEELGTNMAVPYFYEDMMPAAELEAEMRDEKSPLNASYLLYHTGADMKVTQWTQQLVGYEASKVKNGFGENLGRGGAPPPDLANQTFSFNLYRDSQSTVPVVSLAGKIGDRAIHLENENEQIQQLAKRSPTNKSSTSLVLWPDMSNESGVFLAPQGRLIAELVVRGKSHTIDFNYRNLNSSWFRRTVGRLAKKLQPRLKLKFPGRDDGIKYMQTITAWAREEGTQVNLTFSVLPGMDRVELKDVEFLIPYSVLRETPAEAKKRAEQSMRKAFAEEDVAVESMYADPLNVDSMMGLTMALEYAATQIKADLLPPLSASGGGQAAFEQAASIVRKHTRSMLDGKEYDVAPMEVNAAVHTAVNALYELQQVEISISKDNVKKYTDKLTRAGRPAQAEALAVQELTPIVEQLEEIRNAAVARPKKGVKSFFKRKIDTAKKSRLDKQLDEWKVAIENYLNAQPEGTRFAKADALIRRGKNPLATTSPSTSDDEK